MSLIYVLLSVYVWHPRRNILDEISGIYYLGVISGWK